MTDKQIMKMDEIDIKQYNAVVKQNKSFYRETRGYREVLTYIKNARPDNYETFKSMVEDLQLRAKEVLQ